MQLIVGLGNPGGQYEDTRHNIGYMVVDKLAREIARETLLWKEEIKFQAMVAKVGDIVLVKPVTFVNNSGVSVSGVARFYKIDPKNVWVIHDDIDLPLGKIRIRSGGGTGGHNGVDSIIKELGSDSFMRVRLGIGRGREDIKKGSDRNLRHKDVINFVLSRFTQSEAGSLKKLIKYGVEAMRIALMEGVDKAMNRFN